MCATTVDEGRLKELLKEALTEILEERRDLLAGLVEEVIEDIGMLRAIKEGETSPDVSKDKVLDALEGAS